MSTESNPKRPKSDTVETSHFPREKGFDVEHQSSLFRRVVSSIQKPATYLANAASPKYSTQNAARVVEALDKALVQGDVQEAYKFLFEGLSESSVHRGWIGDVSPCLRLSLKRIRSVSFSLVHSVFLLCEWCTCDFRDFRTSPPHDVKFTGRKDFSQLYVAVRLMKLKMREIRRLEKGNEGSDRRADVITVNWRKLEKSSLETPDLFESPSPLHDIIVCWMDQHEAQKGEGSKRVQLLLIELTRRGIFSPLAYARCHGPGNHSTARGRNPWVLAQGCKPKSLSWHGLVFPHRRAGTVLKSWSKGAGQWALIGSPARSIGAQHRRPDGESLPRASPSKHEKGKG